MSDLVFENVAIARPDGSPLLDRIDMVWPASITALAGVNGAGKSTLLRAIAGLVPLRSGAIRLGPDDNRRARAQFQRRMAFMPQNFVAYRDLTADEFLRYVMGLRGVDRHTAARTSEQWLERVGLADVARQQTGTFSQGMLQRLGFACTLQVDVDLYVLDEPFAGVDPDARADLTDLLVTLAKGRPVIVSTHHVAEMVDRGARLAQVSGGTVAL